MILLLAGTSEGRELGKLLQESGFRVMFRVTTEYGRDLVQGEGLDVAVGTNSRTALLELLSTNSFRVVVDTTHQGAPEQEMLAEEVCREFGIPYLRFIREETFLTAGAGVHQVGSWEEAAAVAAGLGNTIFLTTGSNQLEKFLPLWKEKKRLVVRVIPEYQVIKKCQDLGFSPKDIVAMQGPFSKQVNKAMFQAFKTEVVVTRDSGKAGGTDTKLSAVRELKIPVVLIKGQHPKHPCQARSFQEALAFVQGLEIVSKE